MLTRIPSFPMSEGSFLKLFEPYEEKLTRFKARLPAFCELRRDYHWLV